ncbi:MAG: tetratricopeptide repeat protein [Spirochaetaceae bacterium]|jgi:tetratricopeptide (TPR) repeat protein|nr:tetratricopeptide repeat protein [Spirochaetaceae bacterium]
MGKNAKNEKNDIHITDDSDSLFSFFEKNRKFLLTSVIAIAVLLAGLIVVLLVRDFMHKDATARLDVLIERYDSIKYSLAANAETTDEAETEAVESADSGESGISEDSGEPAETAGGNIPALLDDLRALGKSASGYPAARAWFMAANIYHERREWQEAQEAWLLAAEKGGSTHLTPVCLYNAAVAAEASGDTDSALSNYQKSLGFTDFPAAAHAQFSVGRLEETKGDNEAAIAAYRAVIEKWPSDTGWTNLAHSRIVALELNGQ